jgi:hypothetical protein
MSLQTIPIGKHSGKSVAWVVVGDPSFITWIGKGNDKGPLSMVRAEADRLIGIFDRRPILLTCHGCQSRAVRMGLLDGRGPRGWWCAACQPSEIDRLPGEISVASTYRQVLRYLDSYTANRQVQRDVIRALAASKGLPKRLTVGALQNFFADG